MCILWHLTCCFSSWFLNARLFSSSLTSCHLPFPSGVPAGFRCVADLGGPLVNIQKAIEHCPLIVDLPIKNGDFTVRYVNLPEGSENSPVGFQASAQSNEIPPSAILSSRQPSRPIDHWLVRYEVLGNECLLDGCHCLLDGFPDGHFARLWQRCIYRGHHVQPFGGRFLH